jgi:hypothetical protein
MRSVLLFSTSIFVSCLYSCNRLSENRINELNEHKENELKNVKKEDYSKTKSCYVIHYYPDSLNREYLISINGEARYEQIVLDNMESNFEVLQYLDSIRIEAIILDDSFFIFETDTLYRNKLENKYFGFILVVKNKSFEFNKDNYRKRLEKLNCK